MTQPQVRRKVANGARAALPWRSGIPWSWVLAEGIVMLGLGLFMLFARAQTRLVFGVLVSIALAVGGGLQLLAAWRSQQAGVLSREAGSPSAERALAWVRGGIGLGVGLVMLVLILVNAVSLQAARVVLGLGCIGYGGVGGYMLYLKRADGFRIAEILSSTIFALVGILVIAAAFGGVVLGALAQGVSVLLLLLGAFLILWALVLRRQKQTAPVA
ncbi:MAG: hypothetical protein ACM30E_10705 [Nitrososphaerales archaeon]